MRSDVPLILEAAEASGQLYCRAKTDQSEGNAIGHGFDMNHVSLIQGTDMT